MKKIVFLDRDGTISKEYPDEDWKYVNTPELLNNTIKGLKMISDLGYELIILTNQNLIADGIITYEQYEDYNNKLINILKDNGIDILKTYYCPHNDLDKCNCKKPKTGMIDKSLEDFDIDLSNSLYIGDSYSDYELAKKFDLKFYGIKGQNNDNIFRYIDLLDVVEKEVIQMLDSYESVSPTAILTSYPRIFTDIPYEKEIYEWVSKNCNDEIELNKLLAPEIEARYKLINGLLEKQNISQVLELAAGYTSRGLIYSEKGYKYVEMDLEEVSNSKKRLINDLFKQNDNLHIISGNALNMDDYNKCEEYFDNNELAIINEGLLRYLTFEEKRKVGENIYNMLKKHGGVWITCDVTPKSFAKKQEEQNPGINDNINRVTSRNRLNDRFENEEHIRSFFKEIGFNNIEIHKFNEAKDELKSFDILGIDKDSCDGVLDSAIVAVLKI